jgi:acetyl esterase
MTSVEKAASIGLPNLLRSDRPDGEAQSFLFAFNLWAWRPLRSYSLHQIRERWKYFALALGRRDEVARVTEMTIDGPAGSIRLRLYSPEGGRELRPALVWLHGGAFMIGEIATADSICRNLANSSGCVIVAAQYRLAPEHDLYAAHEDGLCVLEWLFNSGDEFGVDPHRLAVGGDSAGGNLAAVLAQEWMRRDRPKLRLQVLVYPATNLADYHPSTAQNARGYLLTEEMMNLVKSLVGKDLDLRDPRLSPAYGADLACVAPALIVAAGFDPIRDDGLAYAASLRRAGVPVELLHYPGQFHGFLNCDTVLNTARDALDRIGGALRRALHPGDPAQPRNRTIEIEILPGHEVRTQIPVVSDVLTTTLMVVDWLEYQRNRFLKTLWPGVATAVEASPLLNIANSIRGSGTALVQATETFNDDTRIGDPV